MSQSTTFSETDQTLVLAVLQQMDVGNFKVDYKALQATLNLNSWKTAQSRWLNFKKKLNGGTPATPTKPKGISKAKKTPTSNKRRKTNGSDDEDAGMGNAGEGENSGEFGGGGDVEMDTPTRKLPGRSARVTNFREDSTSDEGDSGKAEKEENGGAENEQVEDYGRGGAVSWYDAEEALYEEN